MAPLERPGAHARRPRSSSALNFGGAVRAVGGGPSLGVEGRAVRRRNEGEVTIGSGTWNPSLMSSMR